MPVFNQSRQNVIRAIFLVCFVVLILRLLFLQLASSKYDLLALDNAVSKKIVYPDRGIIFDRKGKSILENTQTYDLMVMPTQLKGLDTIGICNILGIDLPAFRERIIGAIIKNGRYRPSVLNPPCLLKLLSNYRRIFFDSNLDFFFKNAPFEPIPTRQPLIYLDM